MQGKESARIWPQQTSRWFEQTAEEILNLAAKAEKSIGKHRNKEFDSTLVDLRILGRLAQYHARRIPAGVNWALFEKTKNLSALDEAIAHEKRAIEAYADIVATAGNIYSDSLLYVRGNFTHWRNELAELKGNLKKLERQRKALDAKAEKAKQKAVPTFVGNTADNPPPPLSSMSLQMTLIMKDSLIRHLS